MHRANPARFGDAGFARDSQNDYQHYFHQLKLQVRTEMIISENDPWLNFQDALQLAKAWKIKAVRTGPSRYILMLLQVLAIP